MLQPNIPPLADDLLVGVDSIAGFLGQPKRRVQHLIDTNVLPTGRMGRLVTTTKTKLREHIERSINAGEAA